KTKNRREQICARRRPHGLKIRATVDSWHRRPARGLVRERHGRVAHATTALPVARVFNRFQPVQAARAPAAPLPPSLTSLFFSVPSVPLCALCNLRAPRRRAEEDAHRRGGRSVESICPRRSFAPMPVSQR